MSVIQHYTNKQEHETKMIHFISDDNVMVNGSYIVKCGSCKAACVYIPLRPINEDGYSRGKDFTR
jgi:hypothetical protein